MKAETNALLLASVLFGLNCLQAAAGTAPQVIDLWPEGPPGTNKTAAAEVDTTKPADNQVGGRRVIRLGNVTKPTLTLYRPSPTNDTGAAVLVCPGGGYHILAMDLEGTEVCDWLNSIGVTGVLLKYRVPKQQGEQRSLAALQDAQRALGMLRHRASEYGIDPKRIGVIGFSAGGHLAAAIFTSTGPRSYPPIDAADGASCRPDFSMLVYPGYLTLKDENDRIAPDLTLSSNTPPTFIAMAQDDSVRVETALCYGLALHKAGVPFELHVYPTGGHGYGLRPSAHAVTTWPARATDWLRSRRLLEQATR
jgi:acetyl esterase/lipase